MAYTIIDLFAGTSALSEGFVNEGFVPVAHVEMDPNACNTIRTRVAYHYLKSANKLQVYNQYLQGLLTREQLYSCVPREYMDTVHNTKIGSDTLPSLFDSIEKSPLYLKNNKTVDFIVGGPPCQAYSLAVRHKEGIAEDDRCFLYRLYAQFLRHYDPIGFVFENVVGLISAAKGEHYMQIQKIFKDYGYRIHPVIVKAEDYGVLQKRRRLIIIGWREDVPYGPIELEKIVNNYTTTQVFSDLADIEANDSSSVYKTPPTDYLKRFGIRCENDTLTWHVSRPLNDIDRQKYAFAIERFLKDNHRISYLEFDDSLQTMKKGEAFTDRFKVVDPNGLCQTVVAHLSKDGHYYIYPSLKHIRSISVREAARLQSFPDNFYFEGSRSAAYKQIGNAVPPLLSHAIAKEIVKTLKYY